MRTQDELNDELRLAVEGYARIAGGEWEEIEEEDAVRLVEWFLREGADPNARDPLLGRSALHVLAASRGSGGGLSEEASIRIGRLLLMAGADPNAESRAFSRTCAALTAAGTIRPLLRAFPPVKEGPGHGIGVSAHVPLAAGRTAEIARAVSRRGSKGRVL